MDNDQYSVLKLEKQLCFPLYACSRETIRLYKPFLDDMELTYTQYISMIVLWERKQVTVKELGNALYLDSGTLTPLLKKLEARGLITRRRSTEDERNLIVTVTDKGEALKDKALVAFHAMAQQFPLSEEEGQTLHMLLRKILENLENQ